MLRKSAVSSTPALRTRTLAPGSSGSGTPGTLGALSPPGTLGTPGTPGTLEHRERPRV